MEPENVSTELNDDGAKSVERGDDNPATEDENREDIERRRKGDSSRSRSRERRRRCVFADSSFRSFEQSSLL